MPNLMNFIDASRTLGSPVTLLRFSFGETADQLVGYTNAEEDIVFGGLTYQAVPCDRDSVRYRGINGRSEFTVRIPNDSRVSQLFRFHPPPFPVSLTVFSGHRTNPSETDRFQTIWTGRVLSGKPTPTLQTTLNCEWAGVSLRRNNATRNYQLSCPLALYGPLCRADRVAATTETVAANIEGFDITVPPGALDRLDSTGQPIDQTKYENGTVSWDTLNGRESRSIVEVNGAGVLRISNEPSGMQVGTPLNITLGCNRLSGLPGDVGDCATLHDNINNFGGWDHIPEENPVSRNNF